MCDKALNIRSLLDISVMEWSGVLGSEKVRQTIISNVGAPRLRGIFVGHFIQVKKLRELYEKEIDEKNKTLT